MLLLFVAPDAIIGENTHTMSDTEDRSQQGTDGGARYGTRPHCHQDPRLGRRMITVTHHQGGLGEAHGSEAVTTGRGAASWNATTVMRVGWLGKEVLTPTLMGATVIMEATVPALVISSTGVPAAVTGRAMPLASGAMPLWSPTAAMVAVAMAAAGTRCIAIPGIRPVMIAQVTATTATHSCDRESACPPDPPTVITTNTPGVMTELMMRRYVLAIKRNETREREGVMYIPSKID